MGAGRSLIYALVITGISLAAPASASAYGDSTQFANERAAGGGDGHYFTGSLTDRYTCRVCHTGEPVDALRITGLPDEGYEPGRRYDIYIEWPETDPMASATSLAVEWVDENGDGVGELEAAPPEEWSPEELCGDAVSVTAFDVDLISAPPRARHILVADACLRPGVRLRWTAPDDARGVVSFHASAVHANRDGNFSGDEVSVLRALFAWRGAPPPEASLLSASCSVDVTGTAGRPPGLALWLVVAALLVRRRR